ncbi:MAG: hypothetical protein WCV00_15700 [Verrucomicrobiia bacterium]
MSPFQVMEHETGPETDSPPILEVTIDPRCIPDKLLPAVIEFAVVVQIMHTHLEAISHQFRPQFRPNNIVAFRNQIERGTETQLLFELRQSQAFGLSRRTFDIMGEHEGKFLAVRPAGPAVRQPACGFVDRPDILP